MKRRNNEGKTKIKKRENRKVGNEGEKSKREKE